MELSKAFKNNDLKINIKGTLEEPLFRASDVGNILGISNTNSCIRNFNDKEKIILNIDTKGGQQKVVFLTREGLKKFICNSRKPNAIDLAKKLGIDMIDTFYIPIETSLVYFLQEVYLNEEIKLQFTVGPYKIDLYFPGYKLAIECDEYFHISQKDDDIKREEYIKEKIGCEFIRFKQDKKNKHLPSLINQINQTIEKSKLDRIRNEIMNLKIK
jgi:very-short-patch-repair endonuclease